MRQPIPLSGYGVLDEDGYWMGGDDGPHVFDNEILARLILEVRSVQFPDKRFSVEPFTSSYRKHDEITSDLTMTEALHVVEGGSRRRRPRLL